MTATLLPEIESVFVDPAEAGRYLLPVATIDASSVHAHLTGPLHFVTPIDPYDGVVGEFTGAFYSETCRSNWVGFRVVDGRYSLDGPHRQNRRLAARLCPMNPFGGKSVANRG